MSAKCPNCKTSVKDKAKKCPRCKWDLQVKSQVQKEERKTT